MKMSIIRSIVLGLALNIAAVAPAASLDVSVDGRAGPWSYVAGGLNDDRQYGINDHHAPVVISAADGFDFSPGGLFEIEYLSGLVSAGDFFPFVDAAGYFANVTDAFPGSSGEVFPSYYFDPADYPTYLVQLVGTFADDFGVIVGDPFSIGLGGTFIVPVGATRLQLGINDDIFVDNRGFFTVRVSGPASVPEPAGLMLLGVASAFGTVAWSRRHRRALREHDVPSHRS